MGSPIGCGHDQNQKDSHGACSDGRPGPRTRPLGLGGRSHLPGSFEVLHNDRIGAMQLPAGPYTITVLDTATMGCTEASHLFTQFLEDWDGRLPRPWVANNTTRTFTAGRGSSVGFRVTPGQPTPPIPPNPPHPPSSRVCGGYFTVLHNDHIGSFSIPKGRYRITLLGYSGPSCSQASTLFARSCRTSTESCRGRGSSTRARAAS